jgi:hypothetical protein
VNVVSLERVKELLDYEPTTGIFRWKGRTGRGKTPLSAPGALAGTTNDSGYRIIRLDRVNFRAHRLAWLYVHGELPKQDIDHINGDRSDNRIANLRSVSRSVNLQNLRSAKSHNKSSGLLGVHLSDNRWIAKLQVDKRTVHIGSFGTAEEASQAYLAAKRSLHAGCTI